MGKNARSARGEMVDFDLIAISQALAAAPAPMNVESRREYIDEREGLKVIKGVPLAQTTQQTKLPEAMQLALEAAETSKAKGKK